VAKPEWLAPGRLAALARDYPDWHTERVGIHPTWVAEFRRGTLVRVIAAHDLDVLRAKMDEATGGHSPITKETPVRFSHPRPPSDSQPL
jgi:hypothetical protein